MVHIHHIFQQAERFLIDPVLTFLGFDIHSVKNKMALPSNPELANELNSSPHTGGHLSSYCKGLSQFLRELRTSQAYADAQAGDAAARASLEAELDSFLATARYALANGHLLTNTPEGMTREQANAQIDRWFANRRKYAEENRIPIRQMQDMVRELHDSGSPDKGLWWPILSPTSNLSLADKIAILRRYASQRPNPPDIPISQQFTALGPLPDLPGLVPPVIDTRLPGLIPPSVEELTQTEGFTPTPNPLRTYGLPGFPVIDPSWQALGQLPPSTATPRDPLILLYDPATGAPLPFSGRSPILEPDPPSSAGSPPAALSALAVGVALGVAFPELIPAMPLWAVRLGTSGLSGTAATATLAAGASNPSSASSGDVFSTGTTPYNAFGSSRPGLNTNTSGGFPAPFGPPSTTDSKSLDQGAPASSFVDRFGNWTETSAGTMPAEASGAPLTPAPDAAQTTAPEDVRRLTRVNASNAANAFTSGAPPVPYLPSSVFDDRFGQWGAPSGYGVSQQPSRPIGVFADEPSYLIPPPLWGLENSGGARNDAEEWFSRWIQPLVRRE